MGKVYLTGAGPGDIDLLTVKALRVVQLADVIIYDRLANPDILLHAKEGCEFIYVAGIPVTHRGITVSFRVVTGHESKNKDHSQIPWENYKSDDTIIFLMGLHRLNYICRKLIEIGKSKEYPVAVISRGTTSDEKTVVGTLETIYDLAKDLPTPALIVVGEVVRLREQLSWFEQE